MKKLNTFMMKHLRSIVTIKWQDKVTNKNVLKRTEQLVDISGTTARCMENHSKVVLEMKVAMMMNIIIIYMSVTYNVHEMPFCILYADDTTLIINKIKSLNGKQLFNN